MSNTQTFVTHRMEGEEESHTLSTRNYNNEFGTSSNLSRAHKVRMDMNKDLEDEKDFELLNDLQSSSASSIDSLPLLLRSEDGNKHISVPTLNDTINGKYAALFDRVIVVDCRYTYEYDGGHISGAINVQSKEEVESLFISNLQNNDTSRIAFIFHCEYSSQRGPRAASFFRQFDRAHNAMNYPNLCYPHCYILHGGYKKYYETQISHICGEVSDTYSYVSMYDESYTQELKEFYGMEHRMWPNTKQSRIKKKRRRISKIRQYSMCIE